MITGLGLVTPLGLGVESNWQALLAGRSAISRITRFDPERFPTRIAGEIKNFDVQQFIDRKEARKMDLFVQYAIVAAELAVQDSGIDTALLQGERTGVYVGSGIGGIGSIEETHRVLLEKGPDRVSPFFIIQTIINEAPGHISIRYRASGPNLANATACSTGAHAIGEAFRMIKLGVADRMIAGGAEAPITPLSLAGFCNMKALSERNDEPEKASRPFDARRDGFVMSEGAGIVLLEELESALKRGARIYAEVLGYGLNSDAYHVTAPSPDGDGAARVMRMALQDGGVNPEEVQYINAHGTSTQYNDKTETLAIKKVFGEGAKKVGVSSTKSMTGHLLGAAGGLETAITALAIFHQVMPPTINYEFPDPECDLDYVPNTARPAEIIHALTNSFGFGGTNACLLLKKFE
ncbi:MAG: 3-oxoacyl-[acyl-carrier-protein] synthase, KASII [Candidatus Saccharicenans subterraneus]|uniref:3-oxoacyl-[acyl-carrier-protein] synthase 2 n=1 Tax=Candidatus Saccharicenans subterraneus TaxID=2508984 RepID=A0A3E2BQB9_9BACT|nr:MAG: 3-oxoacyl-[acyl-carrier-protein] synthase, KASII [Candidatus Saccharicenans subterraneum]